MRELFEQFKINVNHFVEQRQDLLMIVACSDNDAALMLAVLGDVEQANATDVFFLSADDFITTHSYVSAMITRLEEQHEAASQALIEEGRDPLPALPVTLKNEMRSPLERLQEAILFTRSLLPKASGHRLIWAMSPQLIVDRPAYLKLIAEFIPWQGIQPWMSGLRLIFRDNLDDPPSFPNAPRVQRQTIDFGPKAIETALQAEVENEALPKEQRMQALLMLAVQDYGYERPDDAIAKYKVLLAHYQQTENLAMQAFVLNGLGDVYHRAEQLEYARYYYECAVPPVVKAQEPVIFHSIVKSLGDVAFKQKQYAEAEYFYGSADKLAAKLLDAHSKALDLEWCGLSQEKQQAYDRAIFSWENAATLSRNIGMPDSLQSNLEHLKRVYRKIGRADKVATIKAELKQLKT
jgi:tetratricopeptide (TPR) repeat protein